MILPAFLALFFVLSTAEPLHLPIFREEQWCGDSHPGTISLLWRGLWCGTGPPAPWMCYGGTIPEASHKNSVSLAIRWHGLIRCLGGIDNVVGYRLSDTISMGVFSVSAARLLVRNINQCTQSGVLGLAFGGITATTRVSFWQEIINNN
ncbi:hypothetical protein C8J57DRAFT_1236732 [Mycena rebaudengoi]|nr:hypothetical protein C8J57DRAFT_1236732 [Mycena rebaudengoi]